MPPRRRVHLLEEGRPFRTERLPDGGLILRSDFETSPGVPYTYKFAAPDAGFLRQ